MEFELVKSEIAKDYALAKLKSLANAKFLELKNEKDSFQKDENITEADVYYPLDLLNKAKNKDIIRPVEFQNGYLITRLNKVIPIRVKTFEEAKDEILPIYIEEKAKQNLAQKAMKVLENFNADEIGFVSRDSKLENTKINDTLNDAEFSHFLMSVFNSEQNASYVLLNDSKAIAYKINKQKLNASAEKLKQYKTMLEENLQILKASELKQELVDELKKVYPIKIYYKGN